MICLILFIQTLTEMETEVADRIKPYHSRELPKCLYFFKFSSIGNTQYPVSKYVKKNKQANLDIKTACDSEVEISGLLSWILLDEYLAAYSWELTLKRCFSNCHNPFWKPVITAADIADIFYLLPYFSFWLSITECGLRDPINVLHLSQ